MVHKKMAGFVKVFLFVLKYLNISNKLSGFDYFGRVVSQPPFQKR